MRENSIGTVRKGNRGDSSRLRPRTRSTTMVYFVVWCSMSMVFTRAAGTSSDATMDRHSVSLEEEVSYKRNPVVNTDHLHPTTAEALHSHPSWHEVGTNYEPHPDPNDEHYDNMIYVGRLEDHETEGQPRRRLGHDVDNGVKFLFGTSCVEEHADPDHDDHHLHYEHALHTEFLPKDHVHWSTLPSASESSHAVHHDIASRGRKKKTRTDDEEITHEQRLWEDRHTPVDVENGPKPFGHVEIMSDCDGGVTPVKVVHVDPFFLDATPVTNAEFSKFVRSTAYTTEAEKYGWSFVLSSFLPTNHNVDEHETDPEAVHWIAVKGAYWKQPEGPAGKSYKFREHHPVVHVSHFDAAEYCEWKGKRLPGEREYEAAARYLHYHPHNRTQYIWDAHYNVSELEQHSGKVPPEYDLHAAASKYANLWGRGTFPSENFAEDGWRGTSPVKSYPPNPAGFYDLTGNVWEWMRGGKHQARIVRGASYADTVDGSYNHLATLGARDTIHATTTTGNVGFRCAKSPKRRVEYHYQWHDTHESGGLAIEDEFGHRDMIPQRGWEDQFHKELSRHFEDGDFEEEDYFQNSPDDYEFDEEGNDLRQQATKRRMMRYQKRKVVFKREVLSDEL
jgi:formylglycine-generating enzyme